VLIYVRFSLVFPSKVLNYLLPGDLGRFVTYRPVDEDLSESPVTAVSPGAEGTPLVKGRERHPKWTPRPIPGQIQHP
jgi:hypothetical protein